MSEESLPSLREDLNLFEGPPLRNGAPTWTLHDPLRNRYFRIGWIEFELLSRFRLGSVDALLQEVNRIGLVEVTEQRLQQLIRFLRENRLAGSPQPADGGGREYSLFYFKIPLLHPDRMLGNMSRFVGFLFSPFFLLGVLSLGILSILMLFQQWEQFLHTFTAFQSPLGVAAFAVAILFSKLIHELGHGLTAKWYGLRVPTFGVVFMFFWPVLYTDTSDAWRLRSRNARLWIGSAGVIAETILAIIASFCWLWLPEGLPKAIAFTIAVTTWGMTFLVNLNPFMRFDGYFLLSDAWDIPNLQARAFELGRGYLRAWLFGLPASLPLPGESKSGSVWLIGYAYLTWVYRLLVYVALAAAAYLLLFKVLGIVLLVVEMAVLVVKPVVSELRGSWALRGQFRWRWSNRLLVVLLLVGVGGLMVPWKSEVAAPAVWQQAKQQRVYAPENGRIVSIHVEQGAEVEAGQLLLEIEMSALTHQEALLNLQIADQRARLERAQMKQKGRNSIRVEQQGLESLQARLHKLEQRLLRQEVHAPVGGEIIEMNRQHSQGQWVGKGDALLTIADGMQPNLVGYFHERELYRLKEGAVARFLPEMEQTDELALKLDEIAVTNLAMLDEPLLASLYQGELPVRQRRDGVLDLQDSYYRVTFVATASQRFPVGVLRGKVVVEAEPTTYLQRGWDALQRVLIEESGF